MPLRLVYKAETSIPIEIEGIVPSRLKALAPREIEHLAITHGNEERPLGDFFSISGSAADERLEFAGDLRGVHWLGAGMDGGRIDVEGHVGRHSGSQMSGGQLHVAGDAGDFLGVEMRDGLIEMRGSAGDFVAGAYVGRRRGMTGGTILVHGDAGREIGRSMRRGMVAIGGRAGEAPGYEMLAGTILLFGSGGQRPGANMRRGTIGFLGSEAPTPLPTFRRACRWEPQMLRLCLIELRRLGFPMSDDHLSASFTAYNGDLLSLGRGEILSRDAI